MTVVHATDPTTQVLSLLYQQREDIKLCITERNTSSDVQRAIRADDVIMMLGHGNEYGLFSKPDKNGDYRRFLITDKHVQFLRNKTCIGIWCYANKFAEKYKLHGLFSGMIISELQEAIDLGAPATKDEIDMELEKFTIRLKDCIERYGLEQTPLRMKELDDVQSELTKFNYGNLFQFTEKGPRMNNEDCLNIVEIADKRTLFVVCDGMGGHSCGEVASQTVCDAFSEYWLQHSEESDSKQKVLDAAKIASKTLDEKSGYYQMGTTLVMCSIEGKKATIAHAGDSRCYVIDIKGNVKYRTIDHIESSSISLPYINRAFFTRHPEDAVPDVKVVELQPLDRILLCTDGLYNGIDDETLLHTLQCAKDVEQVAEKYRAICEEKAGDNYTAIIIEME